MPPRTRTVGAFVQLALGSARHARAATRAREIVANGPSLASRFGRARRPDQASLPFVATKMNFAEAADCVGVASRDPAQLHSSVATKANPMK